MNHLYKLVALSLMIFSSSSYASQSNFEIAPPPVASPEFKDGQVDTKVSATYVGISGSGFSLNGAGVSVAERKANSDTTALDFSTGVFLMGGSMDISGSSASMMVMSVPLSVNFEYQPVKNDSTSVILFGGPMMNIGLSSSSYSYQTLAITSYTNTYLNNVLIARTPNYTSVTDTMDTSTTTLLYGGQVGIQASINGGDYTYTPFAMLQSQQGSASSSSTSVYSGSSTSSIDLPNFTTTSYGFDILYRPWNMTLSSMLQIASGSGSNNSGFQTTIISLSWKN